MKIFDWERNDIGLDEKGLSFYVVRHIRRGSDGRVAVEISNWGSGYTLFLSEALFPKLVCSHYSGRIFEHINDAFAIADKVIREQSIAVMPNSLRVLL